MGRYKKIARIMGEKLQAWVPQEAPAPELTKTEFPGLPKQQSLEHSPPAAAPGKGQSSGNSKGKTSPHFGGAKGPPTVFEAPKPASITAVNAQEWEKGLIKLTSRKALLAALREGSSLPGNLVGVSSVQEALELRDGWKALIDTDRV